MNKNYSRVQEKLLNFEAEGLQNLYTIRVGDISLLLGVFPLPSLRYTINYTVKDEDNVLMYFSVNECK